MNEPQKRKFSLGDILRRLNDNHAFDDVPAPEQDPESQAQHTANRPQRQPLPPSLPPQPTIGEPATVPPTNNAPETQDDWTQQPTAGPARSAPVVPDLHEPNVAQSAKTADSQFFAAQQQTPGSEPDEEQSDFDLFRYLNVLIRRRTPIILVTIISLGYAIFNFLGANKYYTAKARLLFRPGQDQIVGGKNTAWQYWVDRQKGMNTHLELLKSRVVLERVAENLGQIISAPAIKSSLSISQGESGGQKNDIIELTLNNGNPERAREILNEICRTYIDYRREVNGQEVTRLIVKLETQISKLESDLNDKEDALRRFKETNRMVQVSQETGMVMSKLSNMETALQKTNLQYLEVKERLAVLRKEIGQQEVDIVQSMSYDNPYQKRVADLELQLSTLSAEYSPEHFKVRMIQHEIDTLRSVMAKELHQRAFQQTTLVKNPVRQTLLEDFVQQSIEKAILETRRGAQEQLVEKFNSDLLGLPTLEKEYAFLQRETESLIQTLRMLKTKYEEAKIVRDSQESDLKILELAELPRRAISSARVSNIWMGALIGLFLGIAVAFALEYLDQTIKEPGDVEKLLEIPLLGYVPLIETDKALIDNPKQLAKSIAEPFRAVRANLKHIISQNRLRTLMICSAVKGEGKTTLAANMAITFSLDSKKVVLVDCDLRRPQLHKLFGLPKEIGVADYLEGKCTVQEILKKTNYKNLFIATCGTQPQNPAELVGTVRFDALLDGLKKKADIVFCDSPALLPVSDVITMAPKIDGILMVIRTLWTPTKAARQARNQLKRIGCTIYGGILNGVSHSRGYYPYYYGYYGYYSYKYSYEYDKDPPKKLTARELGLLIEKKIKAGIQAVRLSLPRYVALAERHSRSVLRSKLFWLLVTLLVGLTAWEHSLASKQRNHAEEGIKRLDTLTVTPPVVPTPAIVMVAPDDDTEGSPGLHQKPSPSTDITVLADSLEVWVNALQTLDSVHWYGMYDKDRFRYPDGGWDEWRSSPISHELFPQVSGEKLALENTKVRPFRTDEYAHTTTTTIQMGLVDTVRTIHEMIWCTGPTGWHIIGHKFTRKRS